jgi:hypothetical protein
MCLRIRYSGEPFGNGNELSRSIKTAYVLALLGDYWLLKRRFLPCCCVVILKESVSEGVDSI